MFVGRTVQEFVSDHGVRITIERGSSNRHESADRRVQITNAMPRMAPTSTPGRYAILMKYSDGVHRLCGIGSSFSVVAENPGAIYPETTARAVVEMDLERAVLY